MSFRVHLEAKVTKELRDQKVDLFKATKETEVTKETKG